MKAELDRINPVQLATRTGLAVMMAASLVGCSAKAERPPSVPAKQPRTVLIPPQRPTPTPTQEPTKSGSSETECSKKGIINLDPNFEGPPNVGSFRAVIARAYDVKNNGLTGIYIVTIEAGTLQKQPVRIESHRGLPVSIGIDLQPDNTAMVNIEIAPKPPIQAPFKKIRSDVCNVVKVIWDRIPQRASFNEQTANLTNLK